MTTAVIHFTAGHEVVMSTAFFSQIFFFDYDFVSKSSRERRARRLRRRCTARYDTASSTVELSCTTMRPSETREDAGDWDHIQASGLLVGSGDSRLVVLLLSEFLLWIKVHTNNHW